MNYDSIFDTIIKNKKIAKSYIFYGNIKSAQKNANIFANKINNTDSFTNIIDKKIKREDIDDIINASDSSINGYHKIFIIKNFENIIDNGDEKILKTLECLSENSVFIFIVENLATLKPTIRSRCQKIYFPHVKRENIKYLFSYFSQDFLSGFLNIETLMHDNDIIELLEDFSYFLFLDQCDDYKVYNLIKKAIVDIKFNLDKKLVIENLMIQLVSIK